MLARGLKQDMEFKTEILKDDKVIIDEQFIGILKGLRFEMDLKAGALETDIRSLKKAARQTVGPELKKRIQSIVAQTIPGHLKRQEDRKNLAMVMSEKNVGNVGDGTMPYELRYEIGKYLGGGKRRTRKSKRSKRKSKRQ